MPFDVKLTCEGVGGYTHKERTVAQFRYDDGWARTHNEGALDPILWEPTGEMRANHSVKCDRCPRDDYYRDDQLYPVLDKERAEGRTKVDAADVARALS